MYAPLESRIERAEKDYKEEHENFKNMFKKRDKQRKSYYNYYTTNTWANMKDYDLCINSDMGIDEIAQLIVKVYQNGKLWNIKNIQDTLNIFILVKIELLLLKVLNQDSKMMCRHQHDHRVYVN